MKVFRYCWAEYGSFRETLWSDRIAIFKIGRKIYNTNEFPDVPVFMIVFLCKLTQFAVRSLSDLGRVVLFFMKEYTVISFPYIRV